MVFITHRGLVTLMGHIFWLYVNEMNVSLT